MDPAAPLKVRDAGIYYGFGLGTEKTKNVLEAMYRVYMAPPFDRTTNSNMRSRILWGVRDHEDDKQYLAERFGEALAKHTTLSDEAIQQADAAYRVLTGEEPPHAAEYATRGVYLVVLSDANSGSVETAKQRLAPLLGDAEQNLETKYSLDGDRIVVVVAVRGPGGMRGLMERLRGKPGIEVVAGELLTRELIDGADGDGLREFEKLLPAEQ